MRKLKLTFLMAVIILGVMGAAGAASAGCCPSEECCASCPLC
jgi:hypothetical protein